MKTPKTKKPAQSKKESVAGGQRPRWDAEAHARWQRKVSGGIISSTDEILARNRADRDFGFH